MKPAFFTLSTVLSLSVLSSCDFSITPIDTPAEVLQLRMNGNPTGRPYYLALLRELRSAPEPHEVAIPEAKALATHWATLNTTEDVFLASAASTRFARAHIFDPRQKTPNQFKDLDGRTRTVQYEGPKIYIDEVLGYWLTQSPGAPSVRGMIYTMEGVLPY